MAFEWTLVPTRTKVPWWQNSPREDSFRDVSKNESNFFERMITDIYACAGQPANAINLYIDSYPIF